MLRTVRDVGAAVRRARREAGLSQHALADRAGVSRQWLSRVEAGKGPSAEIGKVPRRPCRPRTCGRPGHHPRDRGRGR
ncbi:helix-turn-helix transcriptional regulator [Ornithinimicrobium pekingense]|nr:helix-turn-helix domain-containing protein [Ornithinimicrobium pekingense]